MLFEFILLIIIFYLVYLWAADLKKNLKVYFKISNIPGPQYKNFLVGNFSELRTTPDQIHLILRKWAKIYYPIYKIFYMHVCTVNILTPEDSELILSKTQHNTKSRIYEILWSWLGSGLLTSADDKWHLRRKLLTPTFHFNILQQFIVTFNEESKSLVKILKQECHKPCIAITPLISKFTLQAIAETAMGTKLDSCEASENEYKEAVRQITPILVYRLIRPWMYPKLLYYLTTKYWKEKKLVRVLHNFTKNVIKLRENSTVGGGGGGAPKSGGGGRKGRLAMLDLLLHAKNSVGNIDYEGIREEVDTFMFEGHDTTAMAIGFALMLFACEKDVQERLVDELRAVLGGGPKEPSLHDLNELKYLERCIKEVLRLYPSVHFISRVLGDDVTTHSGHVLPKNTIVHLSIFDLHHDERIYPDSERFDPDRFLPENVAKRHPFAYLPFSAGPRNCIGQRFAMLEMKAVISEILRNFILEPIDTPETVALMADVVLRPMADIRVKFVPRLNPL